MKTVYTITFMRPDIILENHIVNSFPNYTVGQRIVFDHRIAPKETDLGEKDLDVFEVDDIVHEIKCPKSQLQDDIIEFNTMIYLKVLD